MRSDNLDDDPVADLARRVKILEKGNNLGYSSISEGSLRVASVEGLIVEGSERVTGLLLVDGTLQVTGTESVTGTLVVSGGQIITGTFRIDGETTINGHTVINGTTDIEGHTTFNGPTDIIGALGLSGSMTVKPGGGIDVQNGTVKVGSMRLDPNVSSGAMVFSNGAQVFTNGDTIQVYKGNGVVQLSDTEAKLQLGGAAIVIDAEGIHFYGAVFAHNLPTIEADANAVADDDGRLGKTAG
jgi:hypothetical protein